ncbi:hypothetical protein KCU62_g5575, partial [Aureobasidium sp. EXF-3399]
MSQPDEQVPENVKAYYLTPGGTQKMDSWIHALDKSTPVPGAPAANIPPPAIPAPVFAASDANKTMAWISVDNARAVELAQLKEQVKKMSSTIKQLKTSNDDAIESAARIYHESVKRGATVDGLISQVEKVEKFVAGLESNGSQPAVSSASKSLAVPSSDAILASVMGRGWRPHKPMFE